MASDSNASPKEPEIRPESTDTSDKWQSLPLVLSGIAVLIAALALVANQMGNRAPRIDPIDTMNSKLGQIEARIGDVESQLVSDKLDGVSVQLKRIMFELEQLSSIADDATRSKINQAYQILKPLSEPDTKVKAEVDMQSTVAPENQSQTEPAASGPSEDASPAEQAPARTDSQATDTPAPASETNPVAKPAFPPADSTAPDTTATPPETAPKTDMQPKSGPENAPANPVTHL